MRQDADLSLLRTLYASATVSSAMKPQIFIQQVNRSPDAPIWYGSWDSPRALPPKYRSPWEQDQSDESMPLSPEGSVQAKAQSQLALTWIPALFLHGNDLAAHIQGDIMPRRWDGFVLDLPVKSSLDMLAGLAARMMAVKANP